MTPAPGPLPSPQQFRAARAWLGMTQDEFAAATNLPKRTLIRIEVGDTLPYDNTLAKFRDAFEALGIEFLFEDGKASGIKLRNGKK